MYLPLSCNVSDNERLSVPLWAFLKTLITLKEKNKIYWISWKICHKAKKIKITGSHRHGDLIQYDAFL